MLNVSALVSFLLLGMGAWNAQANMPGYQDITPTLQVLYSPAGTHFPEIFFSDDPPSPFAPLHPPTNVNRPGEEAWLRGALPRSRSGEKYQILEVPGQIFNYIDVWFPLLDGSLAHFYAGDRYPYLERTIKHGSYAFPIPANSLDPVQVLIRARNDTEHPMNIAVSVWTESPWQQHIATSRLWYGAFIGAILALAAYNLFLAFSLRDLSYVYYVGYMLSVLGSTFVLSGLADEYLWPAGKPRPLVSAFTGIAAFFGVAFVNRFLGTRLKMPNAYRISSSIGLASLISGVYLIFNDTLPLVPKGQSAAFVQVLSILAMTYFVSIAMYNYFKGVQQARFLWLGMLSLLACLIIYFSYAHGNLPYNRFIGHIFEAGALVEAVLLSLALADRIRLLSNDKVLAENRALKSEQEFSRKLVAVQEREKQSISEALHDSIGHAVLILKNTLVSIKSNDGSMVGSAAGGKGRGLESPIDQCGQIMEDVRRLSHDLHPHILERLGLEAALESTFERALEPADIAWDLVFESPGNHDIEGDRQITVYRVVQESLSNILKYADASRVDCRIRLEDDTLECRIDDNGIGFELEKVRGDSLGLTESEGRIRLLGGAFNVDSTPGRGTRISFKLPIWPGISYE